MYGTVSANSAVLGSPIQLTGLEISLALNSNRLRKPKSKLYMNDQIRPLAIGGTAYGNKIKNLVTRDVQTWR